MDPLKRIVSKIEDVPEKFRELYVANGSGGYRLNAEPDDGAELKSTLERVKRENTDLKEAARAFEGIDPEAARKALADAEKRKGKKKGDEDDEEVFTKADREALVSKHESEKAELAKEKESIIGRLVRSRVENAIRAQGGAPELLEAAVSGRIKHSVGKDGEVSIRVYNEKGEARLSPKPGSSAEMTLDELVGELKADAIFARGFDAPKGSGSGASQNGGGGANAGLKRSAMSVKDKTAFISEHGNEAFLALPD